MIAYLKGSLLALSAESAIILNNGVGYEVFCSGEAFSALQAKPKEAELFTYLQVKEDGLTLYGFVSLKEKQLFLDLISVSGVGPKLAIGILNGLPSDEVARAIATADVKRLSTVKGLGKKTAEKIVLELHGKISASDLIDAEGTDTTATSVKLQKGSKADEEAMAALVSMGFTKNESQAAIQKAHEAGAIEIEDLLRLALTNL